MWSGATRGVQDRLTLAQSNKLSNTVLMDTRRRTRDLPEGWPNGRDASTTPETNTDPDTHRDTWQICWIRRGNAWHAALLIAWRRTRDEGRWAGCMRWGPREQDCGWVIHGASVQPARPPEGSPPDWSR
jgi:hypothetical protein